MVIRNLIKETQIEDLQVDLLLEGIYKIYGYDFRSYSMPSLKRRLKDLMYELNISSYAEIQQQIFYNPDIFYRFTKKASVTVTEMFRDSDFFISLKENVIPKLKTYPYFKIWHAGCATGEEVYSMAILLYELDLLDRAIIYATDINEASLKTAKDGIYPKGELDKYLINYNKVTKANNFSNYYHEKYDSIKIREFLKERITFAGHNLVTDNIFGEMNLIFCRNVLIYFNKELQDKTLDLFYDSLCNFGYLCLGSKESLFSTSVSKKFDKVYQSERIYRKK